VVVAVIDRTAVTPNAQGCLSRCSSLLILCGVMACSSQLPSSKPLGGIPYDEALAPVEPVVKKKAELTALASPVVALNEEKVGEEVAETIAVIAVEAPETPAIPTGVPEYVWKPLLPGWVMTEQSQVLIAMKMPLPGSSGHKMEMSVAQSATSSLEVKASKEGLPTQFEISHSNSKVEATSLGDSKSQRFETDGKRYSIAVKNGVPEVRASNGSKPPEVEERAIVGEAAGFLALARAAPHLNGTKIQKGERVSVDGEVFKKLIHVHRALKITHAEATVEELAPHAGVAAVRAKLKLGFEMGEAGSAMLVELEWLDVTRLRLLDVSLKGSGKPDPKGLAPAEAMALEANVAVSGHYTYLEP